MQSVITGRVQGYNAYNLSGLTTNHCVGALVPHIFYNIYNFCENFHHSAGDAILQHKAYRFNEHSLYIET